MAAKEKAAPRDNRSDDSTPPPVPQVVDGRFEIKHKIGSGSYSDVHLGCDRVSGEAVAVKFEWTKAEKGRRLLAEAQLYESFHNSGGGVPHVRWWGTEAEFNIMVMDLLGPSLEDLFEQRGRKFGLKTVLMLAHQMLDRIQFVHSRGILHRDIKPQNFLIGVGQQSHKVYIMDFGLAKRFIDPATSCHIPNVKKKGLTGTVRYTTLNVHNGLEPSRRDDIGAIGYVLLYFLRGRLPWQGVNAKSKRTKQRKIGARKERVPHEELCKGFPDELVAFLKHCDGLGYADAPDYNYLRQLLQAVMSRERWPCDWRYDWVEASQPNQQGQAPCSSPPKQQPLAAAPEEQGRTSRSSKRRKVSSIIGEPPRAADEEEEESDEYEYEYDEYDEEEESEDEESEESEEEEEESEPEEEETQGQGLPGNLGEEQTPSTPSVGNAARRSRWG